MESCGRNESTAARECRRGRALMSSGGGIELSRRPWCNHCASGASIIIRRQSRSAAEPGRPSRWYSCTRKRRIRTCEGVVGAHTELLTNSTSTVRARSVDWILRQRREEEGDCDKQRQRKPSADRCICKRRMRACMGVVGAHTEILTNSPITISRCASSPKPRTGRRHCDQQLNKAAQQICTRCKAE